MPTVNLTAQRFRKRARECRQLAKEIREPDWLKVILELAKDLEEEADKLEAEEG